MLPSAISNKLDRRRNAVSTDKEGTEIRNDDTVRESTGERRSGRVLYIHRSFIFCQNRMQNENAGIFVARASNVVVAAKGTKASGAGGAETSINKMNVGPVGQRGMNGAGQNGNSMSPPQRPGAAGAVMGKDRMIDKTCMIRRGNKKGYLGFVQSAFQNDVKVELQTERTSIIVPKDWIKIIDPRTGQAIDMGKGSGGTPRIPTSMATGHAPSGRPGWAGGGHADPTGGQTGAWAAGRTPAWNGGRTPAWKQGPSGGQTPVPAWSRDAGDRTAYGGGGRTSYGGGADGSRTSYGGATSYGGVCFLSLPNARL